MRKERERKQNVSNEEAKTFSLVDGYKLEKEDLDYLFYFCAMFTQGGTGKIRIPLNIPKEKIAREKQLAKLDKIIKSVGTPIVRKDGLIEFVVMFGYLFFDEQASCVIGEMSPGTPYFKEWFERIFTPSNFKEFTALKSKNSKLMYLQLKNNQQGGMWAGTMENFIELLGLPVDSDPDVVMRDVVMPALEELKPFFRDLQVTPIYG